MLPRVVDRPRRDLHGPRRRHRNLGRGRLDLALGLGLGRLSLLPATSAKTGPPLGDNVGTGDGGPGPGAHGDHQWNKTGWGVGETHMWTRPHPGGCPPPRSYPGQPTLPDPKTLLPRKDHPRAGNRSAPRSGRTAAGHARHPTRPAGHRRVVTRRRLGNRLGWPETVHAEKGALSHFAARPTPLTWPGGRWRAGRRG